MEEKKGEDEGGGNGGRALAMRNPGLCVTLVVVIQHIMYRDRVPPSGVVGRTPALIGANDLVSTHPIFRG